MVESSYIELYTIFYIQSALDSRNSFIECYNINI